MNYDSAMSRIVGELIIQHIETEITDQYEELKKQYEQEELQKLQQQREEELKRMQELQRLQEDNVRRFEMLKQAELEAEQSRLQKFSKKSN